MKGKIFKKFIASVSAVAMLASMAFVIPAQASTNLYKEDFETHTIENLGTTIAGNSFERIQSNVAGNSTKFYNVYTSGNGGPRAAVLPVSADVTGKAVTFSMKLKAMGSNKNDTTFTINGDGGSIFTFTYGNGVANPKMNDDAVTLTIAKAANGEMSGASDYNSTAWLDIAVTVDFSSTPSTVKAVVKEDTTVVHEKLYKTTATNIKNIQTALGQSNAAIAYDDISIDELTSSELAEIIPTTHDVKFVVNGVETTETVAHGEKPTIVPADEALARFGYIFRGWTTDGNAVYDSSKTYLTSDQVKAAAITADVTYTAVYEEDTSYVEAMESITLNVPAGNKLVPGADADTPASNPISVDIKGEAGGDLLANPDPSMNLTVEYEVKGFDWLASSNPPGPDNSGAGKLCDDYGEFVVDDSTHTADFKLRLNNFNFYGIVKVTVGYGVGESRKTLTQTKPLVYLGNITQVANQILPSPGYVSDFNRYSPDMVGYVAANSGDNRGATDVVTDNWAGYGSATKTVSIVEENSSKFLRLNTDGKNGTSNGSSFAANQISDTADGQYVTSQKVRFPSGGEIMLKSTYPTNWPSDGTAFSLGYSIKDHTGKVSLNGVDFSDTSTIASGTWYTVVVTYDLTSKKSYAEIYNAEGTGEPIAKSDIVATSGAKSTSHYMFRVSDGVAGNFDFNDVVIKKAEISNDLAITSPTASIVIPDDVDGTAGTATLTLTAKTTEGLPALGKATWSLDRETGITMAESEDGQSLTLTVDSTADPGPLEVTASIGGKTTSYEIQLTGSADNVQFVRDNGKSPASISIPLTKGQTETYTYEARVANGQGETIEGLNIESYELLNAAQTVVYTAETMPAGITFNGETGVLTVSADAKATVVYVRANAKNSDEPPTPISNSMRVDIHGLAFDFGAGTAEDLVEGYTAITPSTTYRDGVSDYGITDGTATVGTESDTTNILTDPGLDSLTGTYTFKVKVEPNRLYKVKAKFKGQLTSEYINSDLSGVQLQHTEFTEEEYTIPVFDDVLDLALSSYTYKDSAGTSHTVDGQKIAYIEISPIDPKSPRPGKPNVFSVGDSTIANNGSWAHGLDNLKRVANATDEPYLALSKLVTFSNNGQGSQQLSSYYTSGNLRNRVLVNIQPGDYVIIGDMGTNGMGSHFEEDLNFYIDSCIALGAKVILNSYSPHGAKIAYNDNGSVKWDYTWCYDSTTNTFTGYRQDEYDNIIRKIWANNTNPNIIGFVDIGHMADDAFNAYVADYANNEYASADAAAQALIACFSDHNHYTGIARDLMLEGYKAVGNFPGAKGIVRVLTEILDADLNGGGDDPTPPPPPTPDTHTVTFNATNATVSIDNEAVTAPVTVDDGDDLTFTVDAPTGYQVTVSAGGNTIAPNADGSYTIENITTDITVTVTAVDLNKWIKYEATYDANGKLLTVESTPDATPQVENNTAEHKIFYWNANMKPWSAE